VDEEVAGWPEVVADSMSTFSRAPEVDLRKLSDAELMARLRNGEHEALSHLFDRYHRLVLSIASKIIRDREEAERCLPSTFMNHRYPESPKRNCGVCASTTVQTNPHVVIFSCTPLKMYDMRASGKNNWKLLSAPVPSGPRLHSKRLKLLPLCSGRLSPDQRANLPSVSSRITYSR